MNVKQMSKLVKRGCYVSGLNLDHRNLLTKESVMKYVSSIDINLLGKIATRRDLEVMHYHLGPVIMNPNASKIEILMLLQMRVMNLKRSLTG